MNKTYKHIIIFLLSFLVVTQSYAVSSVKIRIIDRGQADGILIETPNKKYIVIDAGTNKQQAEYMKDTLGIGVIELLLVTHRHSDHQGGADEILSTITTKKFIGVTEDCPNRTGDNKVRDKISENNVLIAPLKATSDIHNIDGVKLTILPLPALSTCPNKENLNSIMVRMDYGEFSMLFTEDAEERALGFYVANHAALLDVDVLKASHHGSNNGYTDNFLNKVTPNKVVISAGVNGTYQHPHAEAVNKYNSVTSNKVYCTNRHGTLKIFGYRNGNSRIYKQFRNNKPCVYDGTHY